MKVGDVVRTVGELTIGGQSAVDAGDVGVVVGVGDAVSILPFEVEVRFFRTDRIVVTVPFMRYELEAVDVSQAD